MKSPPPPPPPAIEDVPTDLVAGRPGNEEKFVIRARSGARHPLVPRIEPYHFDPNTVRELCWAIWPHDGGDPSPVALVGPKGSGKTSVVEQLAARANQPVMRINCNAATSVSHLKGHTGVEDGSTVFYPGVVTRAMEEGMWLLLDEISGCTPDVSLALFPVFEPHGSVYLERAEPPRYVVRDPRFRIFCTDNVIGAGQERDRFDYSGTNPDTNVALLDRIYSTIPVTYLPAEDEHQVIKLHLPRAADELIELAVRVANLVRKTGGGFSTRQAIQWVRRLHAGRIVGGKVTRGSIDFVIETARFAFLNRMASEADANAVIEVIRRVAGGRA